MRLVAVLACLALSACVTIDHDPSRPPPRGDDYGGRTTQTSNRDVEVSVPDEHDRRIERRSAAQRCAEYGRVERQTRDNEYACVSPSDADQDRAF